MLDTAWSKWGEQQYHDLCLTPELSGLVGEGGTASLGIMAKQASLCPESWAVAGGTEVVISPPLSVLSDLGLVAHPLWASKGWINQESQTNSLQPHPAHRHVYMFEISCQHLKVGKLLVKV